MRLSKGIHMTHVMLDLETWGTASGSDLRSIGAVVFDPIAGTLGDTFYCNVNGGEGYGLKRDQKTVQWWSEQSPEARAALEVDVQTIDAGLVMFARWLEKLQASLVLSQAMSNAPGKVIDTNPVRIWAHGPTFDCTLLEAAYRACLYNVPWHYRAPRCTRTIFEAAGGIEIPTNGTYHNALDDAKNQALAVIEAYRKLRLDALSSMPIHCTNCDAEVHL